MQKSVLFSLVLFVISCSTIQPESSQTQKARSLANESGNDVPVIDVHIHTEFTGRPEPKTGVLQSEAELFRQMREAGVVGAVAHVSDKGENYVDLRNKGIIHCAGAAARPALAVIEAGLRSRKFSCIKIYLGYNHQYAYHPNYEPLYKLAEQFDVPVVFHTGDTYSKTAKLKYSDPLTIDEVAVDHPKVRFVIAHAGNPWIQSAAEVAYKNPNVFIEGSALLIGDLSKLDQDQVNKYMVEPLAWVFGYMEDPSKMMFGTDWPLNDMSAYVNAYKRAIPKEHWQAVFHDNAKRVFKGL
jgi:uncharacterized protein